MNFKEIYNRLDYLSFFRDSFLPEDFVINEEKVELDFQSKYFNEVTFLGHCDSLGLGIYEIKHSSNHDARNGLTIDAYKLISRYSYNNVLILFVPSKQDNYRLSLITIDKKIDDKGINVIKTLSDRKRFSYFLGKDAKTRTPEQYLYGHIIQRVSSIEDLKNRFSVEVVAKEFFAKYKFHYQKFVDYIETSNFKISFFDNNDKAIRDFVKKMMGRIVFLYFLQKKGWMGATSDEYNDGDKNFMNNFWNKSSKDKAFYASHLSRLFFEGLNLNDRNGEFFELPDGTKVKVPFLNGGLFEEENQKYRFITFPPDKMDALFKFLGEYNFTIDENDPYEQEVGIDPEMLGHIFENLLEDNKDKGAYYTPKEIVHFMTQESLIEYLKTGFELNNIELGEEDAITLEELIRHKIISDDITDIEPSYEELKRLHKRSKILEKYGALINQLLDDVKICDPAIGSGAFPMGLLNEIYQCKLAINHSLTSNERAEVKKHIIENSIYGVDIEKGAVDIARLRFWLALIIEEDKPSALPNLDYKIVVGNSLISQFENESIFINWDLKSAGTGKKLAFNMRNKLKELTEKQKEFFTSTNKNELKKEIRDLKIEILEGQIKFNQLKFTDSLDTQTNLYSKNAVRKLKTKLEGISFGLLLRKLQTLKQLPNKTFNHFDWILDFPEILNPEVAGVDAGFDIVIGNPPYLRVQGIKKDNPKFADTLSKTFEAATGSYDLYSVFTEKALELTKKSGVLNFIMPVKWTNAAFGKGLRDIIAKQNAASRIISFGAYQVFNASTYTGLQWFKRDSEFLDYIELDQELKTNTKLKGYLHSLKGDSYCKLPNSDFDEKQWTLTDNTTAGILSKLKKHERTIDTVFDKIFQGIATSKDSVYFLTDCIDHGNVIEGYSKELKKYVKVEKELLKPLLKGDDVHRYDEISTDKVVIFPYQFIIENDSERVVLYKESELKNTYPLGYSYLKECESILRARESGRFNIEGEWFQFGRKQGILFAEKEKLIAPDISLGGNFAYDEKGEFYSTTTLYGYVKKEEVKEDYRFFMAILNSKLMWWYLVNTGTTLANGYFRFKPDYLKPFPIPELDNIKSSDAFVQIVDYILFLKVFPKEQQINEYVPNSHIVNVFEEVVDAMVFELYFPEDFKAADLSLLIHVEDSIQTINWDDLTFSEKINSIHEFYQKLRRSDNKLRNNMKLLDNRLEYLIKPIKSV